MSLDPAPELARSCAERFWSKVDRSGECWTWSATVNSEGYGHFWVPAPVKSQQMVHAHRVAFIIATGEPVPGGLPLDHSCHTRDAQCTGGRSCLHRRCVRPEHLEPVEWVENTMRGLSGAAENARKTHCIRGHLFDMVRLEPNGRERRDCSACRAQARLDRRSRAVALAIGT